MKHLLVAVFALAIAGSSLAFAQDAPAKKAKMEDKHGTMLKSVTCDPACGFCVKGQDEAEVISMVQMHAKKHHNADMSAADVRKMMKDEAMENKDMKMEKKAETKNQ